MKLENQKFVLRTFKSGRYFCTKSGDVFSRALKNGKAGLLDVNKSKKLVGALVAGYRLFQICDYPNRKKYIKGHQLVYLFFNGLHDHKLEINHIDGNKQNNAISNLELVSKSQNELHANKIGLKNFKGENCPTAKLTNKDVLKIRKIWSFGNKTQSEIAGMFNVDRRTVGAIVNKNNWKHI